ncbi:YhfH family protein [Paenalkalicoccus suaedae]|uniref:YhfH family protein n=1 Tax=Paenalkalicoccus suaedae TaxID=2592382 RepID=A0A859FDZ7_9BACI|nr:protein YhfH [Paenalkalicoccus suaedae]QKS71317.1 YhfH family protein [Paenalkalicoccus suaedae]
MLMTSSEFFRNLPPKQCTKCGSHLDEMHESYVQECDSCQTEGIWAKPN